MSQRGSFFFSPWPGSVPDCRAKTVPIDEDDGEAAQVENDQGIF